MLNYTKLGGLMKKRLNQSLALVLSVCIAVFTPQAAHADISPQPTLVSFTMTPDTVDIATANTTVSFNLVVSNPTGISSTQTMVTLSSTAGNTFTTYLKRTDVPVMSSSQVVTFQGSLIVPSTAAPGIYTATASPIFSLSADGSTGLSTSTLTATSTSKVVGAPNSLSVRNGGYLDFSYKTFAGPTFNNTLGLSFVNPKYTTIAAPIWKVGETFNPGDYYELRVPNLQLKIKSSTSTICSSDGVTLTLLSIGACSFTVYTDRNLDYPYQKDDEVVNVTSARVKPSYSPGSIPTQSSKILPLSVNGPFVYGPAGIVIPVSATPTVCYPVGTYITVISGGICTLNYSTPASSTYLASDVYPLTFEITRSTQTVAFTAVPPAPIAGKTLNLSATSTSGLPITFQSDSPSICSVNGSSLNLLKSGSCVVEAVQSGSATIAPASLAQTILVSSAPAPSKKIVCVKAGKSKVFVATKCPTGYKVKK